MGHCSLTRDDGKSLKFVPLELGKAQLHPIETMAEEYGCFVVCGAWWKSYLAEYASDVDQNRFVALVGRPKAVRRALAGILSSLASDASEAAGAERE